MPSTEKEETSIGVTAFKSQCLGLIDEVAQGKTSRIILTKHNKPVAAVVPIAVESKKIHTFEEIWGAMEGTVTIAPGVDLTAPIDVEWDALK